ncbi:MAG: cupin domain-containing protein, partial [Planctomycetota bacterium]
MTEPREPTVFHADEGIWLWWLGHRIRYLATKAETDGQYSASVGLAKQGGKAPPHSHEFDEGFYVLNGEIEFFAGNQSVVLGQGDFINISAGITHYPRILSESAETLVIAAPTGFDQFQFEAGQHLSEKTSQPTKTTAEVMSDIQRIAPKYGIDVNPPEASLNVEPRIHVTRSSEGEIVDAVGDRYRFLAEGDHTDGTYAIWHATISPGGGPPPHVHTQEDEAFFVLNGELIFEADGKSFVGKQGTFVNLPKGSRHRFSNSSGTPAEVLILVAPSGLEKMFRRTGTLIEDVSIPNTIPYIEEKHRLV